MNKPISARELRRILFNLSEQEMTVRELRTALFNMDDQDYEYTHVERMDWQMRLENKEEGND